MLQATRRGLLVRDLDNLHEILSSNFITANIKSKRKIH